ncbi:hypothetical protein BE11_40645 [Sorangium cellulosum]|nr:hypothetical protein BE11_40645 [Sorangium cellulosum]
MAPAGIFTVLLALALALALAINKTPRLSEPSQSPPGSLPLRGSWCLGARGRTVPGVCASEHPSFRSNHASGISLYAIDGSEGSSRNKVYNNTIVMAEGSRWVINIPASPDGIANPRCNRIVNNILYTPRLDRGSILIHPGGAEDPC